VLWYLVRRRTGCSNKCAEHVADMINKTIQAVTVEDNLHELHTKYLSLLGVYPEKNLLEFLKHDISECNAVLKTLQGSRKVRSEGELDEGRTLKTAECVKMEKSMESQDCAYRGTIQGTGADEQEVSGKGADEGRDINGVHTGILSLIRSKWIQNPKIWGDLMIYGETNMQYKRKHEFQALLRLYLNGHPGKVYKDPIDTVVMRNVKIAFGRLFVNKTDAQKLSYFHETLEPLFGSYLPRTLEELVGYFGISIQGKKITLSSSMVVGTDPEISETSSSGFEAKAQVHTGGRSSDLSSKIAGRRDAAGVLGLSGLQDILTLKQSKSENGAVLNQILPRLVVLRPGLSNPSMRQLQFSQDYGKAPKRRKMVQTCPNATTQRHTQTNTQSHVQISILSTPERCRLAPVLVPETNELTVPATIQSNTLVAGKSCETNKPQIAMVLDYSLNAEDIGLLIKNVIRTMS